MKKNLLILLCIVISCIAKSQNLTVTSYPLPNNETSSSQNFIINNSIYIVSEYNNNLYKFNQNTGQYTLINLPSGTTIYGDIQLLNNSAYLILRDQSNNYVLYKYDGNTFTNIALPGGKNISNSNKVIVPYNNNIYIFMDDNSQNIYNQLYKYNGTNFTSISLPANCSINSSIIPQVYNGNLYLSMNTNTSSYQLFKYDSVSFTQIMLPGNFRLDNYSYGYNNVNTKKLMTVFNNKLCLSLSDGSQGIYGTLHMYDGSNFSQITLPVSSSSNFSYRVTEFGTVMGNNLYLTIEEGFSGIRGLLCSFDGTNLTQISTPSQQNGGATFLKMEGAGLISLNNALYGVVSIYTFVSGGYNITNTFSKLSFCLNTFSTTNQISCDNFTWNGTNYNSSGTYNYTTTNVNGCDSVASVNLTISNCSSNLREDFSNNTFPPSSWSKGATSAWQRSSASAYGNGDGSAMCNFYNWSSGIDSLTSPIFNSTSNSDSLIFDYAYATYVSEIDILKVYTSTNGGNTWTLLQQLNGGPNVGTGMVTAASTTGFFTPASNQWNTKKYLLNSGINRIKFEVTSAYGNNLFLDNIQIKNNNSSNADLINLTTSVGTLSKPFTTSILNYSTNVSNSTLNLTVTPTSSNNNSTLQIRVNNGSFVSTSNGLPSSDLPLISGQNTIEIKVTPQNGISFKTYVITVNRAYSSNANLSDITISSTKLNPLFSSTTYAYKTNVKYSSSKVLINPIKSDSNATAQIQINGGTFNNISNGGSSDSLILNTGNNVINVKVTAQDGITIQNYIITVSRAIAPPIISYTSGTKIFPTGSAISNLTPSNSGGTVPQLAYGAVTTLAGSGTQGSTDSLGTLASFGQLMGLTIDTAGNLYVTDNGNSKIRKITPTGVVTTFAGTGAIGSSDNSVATSATFAYPSCIKYQASTGKFYVGDYGTRKIRAINPNGSVNTIAGSGAYTAIDSSNGILASFKAPWGLDIDSYGNIYVSDADNSTIRKITPSGAVSTIAGTSGITGTKDSIGILASFNHPNGISFDESGNLFIADRGNNKIRKITPAGQVSTLAGTGSVGSSDNNNPTLATFYQPSDLAFDVLGNLYVADGNSFKIRKISPSGAVTTVAGSGTYASIDGLGTAASFAVPSGLALDPTGNTYLYVSEQFGYKVRKISLQGYSIKPNLPAGLTFDATTGIISGTPTIATSTTTYTITAYNISGSSSTNVIISTPSNNAKLASLTLSSGTLNPTFNADTLGYVASVNNTTSSITLTAVRSNSGATMQTRINGGNYINISSGVASSSLALNVGSNIINVNVTAQDGSTIRTYNIIINRAASSNANLSNLILSSGALSPVFSSLTTSYTSNVLYATSSFNITPTKADANASIQVRLNNGAYTNITSGVASNSFSLSVGTNLVELKVTAQDGSTKVYTVTITRGAASTNTNLSTLTISSGTLSPSFTPSILLYSDTVINSISSVSVTPTLQDTLSSMNYRINNGTFTTINSGMGTNALPLNVGINTIDIRVTSEDNSISKTYTILVYRPASSIGLNLKAFLQGLYLGSETMIASPFSADGISPSNIADTIIVELRDTTASYNLVISKRATLSVAGISNISFPGTVNGSTYYIVVKHRNSIATWSASPITFGATNNYDFSNNANKAFGDNLADDGNGVFMIFSGDINQDGSVDFNDYPPLDISSNNGDLGYYATDLNGDASVDFNDYPVLDINSNLGILVINP